MQREMNANSVDLIYLDPPFNSNRNYNAIYKDETGRPLPDQIEAFCDLWTLDNQREQAIRKMPEFMRSQNIDESIVKFWTVWMKALRDTNPKLLAYLSYMVERLVQMKIILRPTGSIYLHCDPTYSHYIKVIMDGIFDEKNYRAEIVWKRHNAHNDRLFGRIHDTIFYYSYGDRNIPNDVLIPLSDDRRKAYSNSDDHGKYERADLTASGMSGGESGQPWCDISPGNRHWAPPLRGKYAEYIEENFIPNYRSIKSVHSRLDALNKAELIHWSGRGNPRLKRYLAQDAGMPPQSIWDDIPPVRGEEDKGYPTQKPVDLLKRIIKASSKENDVIFDPFCGCGTTLAASQCLNRKWIGIDIAIHAIKRVSAIRLGEECGLVEERDYEITGIPRTLEGAEDLWKRDKYQFEKWAVEMVDGFVTTRKSRDGGIDGRLYFPSSEDDDLKAMKLQVKGGATVKIESLRALAGVIDEEDYPMGGFITRKTLGRMQKKNFLDFCRSKGEVKIGGIFYPRLQILCIEEIFEGKRFNTPVVRGRSSTDQLRFDLE